MLVAWHTLFDRWIPNKVGQAFRNPSFWQRVGAQSAVFRWNPFFVHFGYMGNGKSRREAQGLNTVLPCMLQLCTRRTADRAAQGKPGSCGLQTATETRARKALCLLEDPIG